MSETNAEGQHPREGADPHRGVKADYVGPGDGDEDADENHREEHELEPDGPAREEPVPLDEDSE